MPVSIRRAMTAFFPIFLFSINVVISSFVCLSNLPFPLLSPKLCVGGCVGGCASACQCM